MFSYLRPGHAKRNASNLASPEPVLSPAAHPLPSPSQSTDYFLSPRFSDNASHLSSSPISPFPPQLPPIARVASKLDKTQSGSRPAPPAGRPATSTGGSSRAIGLDQGMLSPPQRSQEQLSPSHEAPHLSARPVTANTPTGLRPQGLSTAPHPDTSPHLENPSQSATHLAPSTISPSYSSFSRSQTSLMSGISEKLSGSSRTTSTPTAAPAKGKSRLNLRNPMSLLMRRRSGQTLDPLSDDALVSHRSPAIVPPMPENYDPSIRGHIVHDFNAPRINRNFSYNNAYGGDQPQPGEGRVSPPKIDREHTPVFREHFDDDTSYEQSQAAIRAEQLANKDFLARNSVQLPPPGHSPPPPPPLPKDSPPPAPPPVSSPPTRPPFTPADTSSTVLSPVQETEDPMDVSAEPTPRKRKSTKTPPVARSRATSVTDPSFQPAGLPAHFTSRASRFSFQISGGSDSAQEAILEERHKQKAAEKASKQVRMSTNTLDDEYDEYGMDDYDMDGGYEEEIPMLGEEDDFGGLGDQSMDAGITTFDFSSLSIQPNLNDPMSPMIGQLQTPVDANGVPIGFAMSEEMLQQYQQAGIGGNVDQLHSSAERLETGLIGQLLVSNHSSSLQSSSSIPAEGKRTNGPSPGDIDLGDDMYFDDGLIGEQDHQDVAEFDENVFDDPEGPLYERKIRPPPIEDIPNALASHPPGLPASETGYEADDDNLTGHLDTSEPSLAHKTTVVHQGPVPDLNNMNAYHSALADAATRAEAAGRFARKASVDAGRSSSDAEDLSSLSNSRPSLVPDDGRFSLETDSFPQDDDVFGMSSGFIDDYDYSDFDSALEDDPMIAAANAEALAYDDEGFYGQEFGFYASQIGDSPNAWGGFFGPSGLGRAVSGRNAVREPNLTPITERSEYSTRNSFISLNHFRDGQQPLASPGLAQLARMSPYGWPEEEDMSLDTLMKLRKGAFGGSAASLPGSTSNSPRNSSPMGMQFVPRMSSPAGNRMKEHTDSELESDESANLEDGFEGEDDDGLMDAVNAAYEDENDSDDSAGEERPESPTLTASDYNSLSSPESHLDRQMKDLPPLPSAAQLQALHNSVTYVREHDEAGEGRWILERRRTAESGELELIGREIVEGGRI
ncbi:hypothetical protein FB567DRAFT_433875 [Paraphoma chrysanthemicola]|uniref:Uncharacterized protein n=1 Tax=Paraphoma chrysanthemicola TaxID=798071 RepID=A0A8K0W2U4_9PLEO|nr:hypothetical protein FB567DRAFT_433875 [Paraphoma chrysanthemicola]